MKIALVSTYPLHTSGGVQRQALDLHQQLIKRGHESLLVSASPDVESDKHLVMGRFFSLNLGKITNNSYTYWTRAAIEDCKLPAGFEVAHLHEPLNLPFSFGHAVAVANPGLVRVAHMHAFNPMIDEWSWFTYPYYRRTCPDFEKIVASSDASAHPFRQAGFSVEVFPNGVDAERLSPKAGRLKEYDDGKKNVLFVGRAEARKGLPLLLEAWPKIVRALGAGNARLLIAGGRSYREVERMKRWAAALPERDSIHVLGAVSEEKKAQLLATADVFVSPATGNESFGVVLTEAMACGTPPVSFNIPGYRSVIGERADELMAKPFDVDDLAAKILRILGDATLRKSLSDWGLNEIHGKYTWDVLCTRALTMYQQLLDTKRSRALT